MKWIVGGKKIFTDYAKALAYANEIFQKTGNIVSVEQVTK